MFTFPDVPGVTVLTGEYSPTIILISMLIACCASYTAISLNQRMKKNSFFHKSFWRALSSVAMGMGIWSMHFVGMSALMLPIVMKYNLYITLLSALPAVLASYLAFVIANRSNTSQRSYLLAGVVMGLGISAMHYIGMSAMETDAAFIYKPWIMAASVIIAIGVSYAALFVFSYLQKYMGNQWIKLATSILMGLAITSSHYTGMAAVVFYVEDLPMDQIMNQMHMLDMSPLIIGVTVGVFLLLIGSGLATVLDHYVDNRLNHYDALTLFPNQRQFERDLDHLHQIQGLAIIHIDNLERWISGYGYIFGEKIITAVANSLNNTKHSTLKVYRIEGHRFAVMCQDKVGAEHLKMIMEQVLGSFKRPVLIDNHRIIVSMVCSLYRQEEVKNAREVFTNTMSVLYHPSIRYIHEVVEYDSAIHTYGFERQIIDDIQAALMNHDFFMMYQPKVCSSSGEVVGLEALVRWEHPLYGVIPPGVFIPLLEESGDIYELTDWVIQEVCKQISNWLEKDVPVYKVAVNVPGSYVNSPRLLSVLQQNLLAYQINSSYMELEITETSFIHDIENAITAIGVFRSLGFSVALDDFGTGVSSLTYLRKIPASTIKIDKSFVDGVPAMPKDSAVLKAIVKLCYSLNMEVVIEGVETKEQVAFISSMKDTVQIQGYYYSRPLLPDALGEWLTRTTVQQMSRSGR